MASSTNLKQCPKCTDLVEGIAEACPRCGYRFIPEFVPTMPNAYSAPLPPPYVEEPARNTTAILWGVGVTVLVFLLIGAGLAVNYINGENHRKAKLAEYTAFYAKPEGTWVGSSLDFTSKNQGGGEAEIAIVRLENGNLSYQTGKGAFLVFDFAFAEGESRFTSPIEFGQTYEGPARELAAGIYEARLPVPNSFGAVTLKFEMGEKGSARVTYDLTAADGQKGKWDLVKTKDEPRSMERIYIAQRTHKQFAKGQLIDED